MADIKTIQMRMMLNSYEQQLLAARRLARFRVKKRLEDGLRPHDPDPSIKRRGFVQKVAQELYDSLIFTGSSNPVVEEIRKDLSRELKQNVDFTYPPGGRLCIVVREEGGARPLNEDEQMKAKKALWRITSQKVDQHMLEKPDKAGVCC